jgi:plasmid stabilization system protein ParE
VAHRVAPEAEVELDDIWFYIAGASGSFEIADRFIDREDVLILHVVRGSRDMEALFD